MNPKKADMITLETMPNDMLMVIVSKVGATSSLDYFNTITSCKSLNFELLKIQQRGCKLHQGLLEFFHRENESLGLHHLRLSSKGGHKEATFIYGVVLMALGMTEKGMNIINKLNDKEGPIILDSLWTNIQNSLEHINVTMKTAYVTSLKMMKPVLPCHPHDMNTFCPTCFYFFFMCEFFEFVLGLNSI
ncbi:hypothetical protein HID58_091812 [Brassica napus]|uniref:At2g35280-like TPR domain-containing protein n=1 Tax=Brassica napus TaxID=3708 RepID=A0ABQ7X0S6_BRANA|nr:hypothetical protein HID58_091812 [Brassica napus]